MKIGIMQPYFFPYLGYFQLINVVDTFVLYDDVQYIQRGWINRNYLLSAEGKSLITIPTINKFGLLINETKISDQKGWREKIIKSIYFSYKKAPYFDIIFPFIEVVVNNQSQFISEIAIQSIKTVIDYLNIKTELVKSSNLEYSKDNRINKINEILSLTNANEFILPPGSISLYRKSDFIVPTNFLIPDEEINYRQYNNSRFESNLSIIDILMFNEKQQIMNLLTRYKLV